MAEPTAALVPGNGVARSSVGSQHIDMGTPPSTLLLDHTVKTSKQFELNEM